MDLRALYTLSYLTLSLACGGTSGAVAMGFATQILSHLPSLGIVGGSTKKGLNLEPKNDNFPKGNSLFRPFFGEKCSKLEVCNVWEKGFQVYQRWHHQPTDSKSIKSQILTEQLLRKGGKSPVPTWFFFGLEGLMLDSDGWIASHFSAPKKRHLDTHFLDATFGHQGGDWMWGKWWEEVLLLADFSCNFSCFFRRCGPSSCNEWLPPPQDCAFPVILRPKGRCLFSHPPNLSKIRQIHHKGTRGWWNSWASNLLGQVMQTTQMKAQLTRLLWLVW